LRRSPLPETPYGPPPFPDTEQQKEAIRRRAQGATLDELARSYNVSRLQFHDWEAERWVRRARNKLPRIDTDDDPIDYGRVRELSEEFTQFWKRLQGFYLDAVAGFNLIRDHVEKNQEQMRAYVRGSELDSEAFQDTRIFTYANIFEDRNFCTAGIHQATLGEAKERPET
jgi:hypothetical protein